MIMKYVYSFVAFILFFITGVIGYRLISSQLRSLNTQDSLITRVELSEYKKSGVKLRYTVKGPIVADENHRELVFEIGQGIRSVKLYKGYNSSLVKELQLANNFNAYEAFAGALYSSGFLTERTSQKNSKYENQCPNGRHYIAEIIGADNKVSKSLWRVSCETNIGNMKSSPTGVLDLFKSQFPEYSKFSNDITID